ncbi:MAG TPA: hypothetical protein PKJ68_06560, partial [Candidatus Woesebacteria bacterium]|nr:hypothetical protein [Candidatus Woesebacteria bacterium]
MANTVRSNGIKPDSSSFFTLLFLLVHKRFVQKKLENAPFFVVFKLFEQGLLLLAELGWRFNMYSHDVCAPAFTLEVRDAVAGKFEIRASLRAGRDL